MSGSKLRLPVVLACLFALSNGSAYAGSRSALDINDTIQPATRVRGEEGASTTIWEPGERGDGLKAFQKPAKEPRVSAKGPKMKLPAIGFPKFKGGNDEPKTAKAESHASSKHSQSSLDQDSHSGGGIGGIGSSIANAAKSSGNFFVKGTKAIGSSMKKGTEAVGSKMASLPGLGHGSDDKKEEPARAVASKPDKAAPLPKIRPTFGQIDASKDWPDGNSPARTVMTQPTAGATTVSNKSAPHQGFFGKAMDKVPFLSGSKNGTL